MPAENYPSPWCPERDHAEEDEELERTRSYIRSQTEGLLDYIHYAGRFPNDAEVVNALQKILELVPEIRTPKDK